MDLSGVDLSIFKNASVFVLASDSNIVSRFIRDILEIQKTDGIRNIVTHEQSLPIYQKIGDDVIVSTLFTPSTYANLQSLQNSVLVFDDCFEDNSWMQDRVLQSLICFPRTLSITPIFGFKHLHRLSPRLRTGFDILCIGTNEQPAVRKLLWDHFLYAHCYFDTLNLLMDRYTKENGFLIMRCDRLGSLQGTTFHYTVS